MTLHRCLGVCRWLVLQPPISCTFRHGHPCLLTVCSVGLVHVTNDCHVYERRAVLWGSPWLLRRRGQLVRTVKLRVPFIFGSIYISTACFVCCMFVCCLYVCLFVCYLFACCLFVCCLGLRVYMFVWSANSHNCCTYFAACAAIGYGRPFLDKTQFSRGREGKGGHFRLAVYLLSILPCPVISSVVFLVV